MSHFSPKFGWTRITNSENQWNLQLKLQCHIICSNIRCPGKVLRYRPRNSVLFLSAIICVCVDCHINVMFHFRFRLKCGKCAIATIFAFKLFEFLYFYTTNSRYSSAETNRMFDLPLISPSNKLAPMLCICRRTNCRRDCVGGQSALSSASTLVISLPSRLSLAYTAKRSKHVHFNSWVCFWFRTFLRHTAHNLHLYQSAFFSCIIMYTKMMFLTTWNRTSPCIRFSEQSKRFRGFHSNKIVENTARYDPVLTWRLYRFCHFAVRRSLAHVHDA